MPDAVPDAVFVNTATRYQRELLALSGIGTVSGGRLAGAFGDVPVVEPGRHTSVRAGTLLVPCLPNPRPHGSPLDHGLVARASARANHRRETAPALRHARLPAEHPAAGQ